MTNVKLDTPRWMRPVEADIDYDKFSVIQLTDGTIRQRYTVILKGWETKERLRLGYLCPVCLEPTETPYPPECPVCKAPGSDWPLVFESEFEGQFVFNPEGIEQAETATHGRTDFKTGRSFFWKPGDPL